MYKVLILDKNNLNILATSFISSLTFKEDLILSQTSTITLLHEITYEPNNDFIFIMGDDFTYLGIVETINEELPMKLTFNTLLKLFDIDIYEDTYKGNMGDLIKDLIDKYLIVNDDTLINLNNIEIINNVDIEDEYIFDNTIIDNLKSVLEELVLKYDIVIVPQLEFNLGKPNKIIIELKTIENKITLKEDYSFIQDVNIEDSSTSNINKITYIPSVDNETYTNKFSYYLLDDGKVTTDIDDVKRIKPVVYKYEFYSDSDYDNLEDKANIVLQVNTYEHYISFKLFKNDLTNYDSLVLGNQVTFITKAGKVYYSIITQIERTDFNGNLKILLGVKRITLTDKLKQGGLQWR